MTSKNENKSSLPEENNLCVWGDNSFGQLAFDNTNNELKVFVPKMLNFGIHIVEISCGFEHSLLRSIEGELYSVGNNKKGQLGIGRKIKRRMAPTMINLEDSKEKILLAASQGDHNIAYTEYGNIYVWGDNSSGQLGTGDLDIREYPVSITHRFSLDQEQSVITISCGREHSAILLNNLKCIVWGSNEFYQLGIEAKNNDNVLVPTNTMMSNIKGIAAGYEHTLFLDNEGGVWVAGNNDNERLLPGKKIPRIKVPTKINFEEPVKRLYSSNMNCMITENNNLYMWGCFMNQVMPIFNPFEEGDNDSRNQKTEPGKLHNRDNISNSQSNNLNVPDKSLIKFRIETASLGENFFIAADEFGDCFAWGYNGNGELGQTLTKENESMTLITFPKRIDILSPFEVKSIYAGKSFVFTIVSEKPAELEYEDANLIEYQNETDQMTRENEKFKGLKERNIDTESEQSEKSRKNVKKENQKVKADLPPDMDQIETNHFSEKSNQESFEEIKLNLDKHAADVIKILIFLYENLRFHLIKIIDETLDVDKTIPPELIQLIKNQQDIIDDYVTRCNLKLELPITIENDNIMSFKYPDALKLMADQNKGIEYKAEVPTNNLDPTDEVLKEQQKTKRIKTETLIKITQLNAMISERIPELKKILKIK